MSYEMFDPPYEAAGRLPWEKIADSNEDHSEQPRMRNSVSNFIRAVLFSPFARSCGHSIREF